MNCLSNQGKSAIVNFGSWYSTVKMADGSEIYSDFARTCDYAPKKEMDLMEELTDEATLLNANALKQAPKIKKEVNGLYRSFDLQNGEKAKVVEIVEPTNDDFEFGGILWGERNSNLDNFVKINESDKNGNLLRTSLFKNGKIEKVFTPNEKYEFKNGKLTSYFTDNDLKWLYFNKEGELSSFGLNHTGKKNSFDKYSSVKFVDSEPVRYSVIQERHYAIGDQTLREIAKTDNGKWIKLV